MFKDYPHINAPSPDIPNTIIKSLRNASVLKKEFHVLNFLQSQGFVPGVGKFNGRTFHEEMLSGKEIAVSNLSDATLGALARRLRKLHLLTIPPHIEKYARNAFLSNGKYRPRLVLAAILRKAPLSPVSKQALRTIAKNIELKLKKSVYPISLIHGDLSRHNILLSKGRIFLIDWTDCRMDISSCDVSQLFYLLKLTPGQEKVFLKHYNMPYIDRELLTFHKLLLSLYDFAATVRKNPIAAKRYLATMRRWQNTFYE